MSDSYCSFEHGHGRGTAQSGSPAAAACCSTKSRRTACMATRSAASLKVVNSPATSCSPRWRRTWRLHALSLPLLQERRMRFIAMGCGREPAFAFALFGGCKSEILGEQKLFSAQFFDRISQLSCFLKFKALGRLPHIAF